VSRFLKWIEDEGPKGRNRRDDRPGQIARASARRSAAQGPELRHHSRHSGPNGALPHYKGTAESNLQFRKGTLYLVDSGGQYQDGTTDITRTGADRRADGGR
jgi:Xaa-Pro aminopeptidase